ncbi:hypothetical protein Q31a_52100 [Aureliella helgolandensis]|uniref:Uncharacterized protein n=1 Tax=Aureliella helgolandensis TaxID=2527968 RepID=A0A518GE06_9BACT|nr:hypothetical protein Q31a_52100 [Aureliella helgolandensis]
MLDRIQGIWQARQCRWLAGGITAGSAALDARRIGAAVSSFSIVAPARSKADFQPRNRREMRKEGLESCSSGSSLGFELFAYFASFAVILFFLVAENAICGVANLAGTTLTPSCRS